MINMRIILLCVFVLFVSYKQFPYRSAVIINMPKLATDTFPSRYFAPRIIYTNNGDTGELFNAYGKVIGNLNQQDTTRWASGMRRVPGTLNVQMRKGGEWVDVFNDSLGTGTTNTRFSITKGTADSVQLVNDVTTIPEMGKAWRYGLDSAGSRGFSEDKYVIAKTHIELRKLRNIDTAHVYRLITNGAVGDFYYDPSDESTVDDTVMVIVVAGKRLKRYVANVVDVRWFGANPADDGADDYPYIQNAINWCVKSRTHGTLYIPGGIYNISRGLLVLRDDNNDGVTDYVSLDIIGDKAGGDDAYAISGNGGTTVLRLKDSTDFCIGVQKGKTMNIKNIAMVGFNLTYDINTNNMLAPGTQWTLPGIRNNRYSPNAGIVLDPFGSSSVLMANRYPLRTGNYGEISSAGSSAINIESCWFRGFAVGICNSPSGVIQNGEGHSFKHIWVGHVASAIANCNQQNRTIYCLDIKAWDAIEVVFDHQRYGDGTSSAMYVEDANIAGGVKWLVATTNWGIGYYHQFNKVHAESLYGIGGDIVGGTQLGHISLKNCEIDLTGESIGISQRAPVIAWCNVFELQDTYMGGYSEGDGNMLFVNSAMVIRRNCTGNAIATQSSYENTVFDELNINDGVRPRYYATGATGIANEITLKPGLEIQKNAYLDFAPGGISLRQKYCGKALNSYLLSGTYTPVSIDSMARTAVFNVGGQIYKVAPGAQVVTLLPDDVTGTLRVASLGAVLSVNVGAQTFVVSRLSHKVTSATTDLTLVMYQIPKLHSTASFYIGDITNGSAVVNNLSGDFNAGHNMQVGQYFNHPAFIPGTYITAVGGTEITLSTGAVYSETGAFVLNETSWENTGISGEFQATSNSFYNSTVFKEGDVIRMGYSNNSNALDTAKLLFVCTKSGRYDGLRPPRFKSVSFNPMTTIGDIVMAGANGVPIRLPIGTASQQLRVNAGATALEYFTPSSSTTLYTGNGSITGGDRTVSQGSNALTFTGSAAFEVLGSRAFNMGSVGSPLSSVNLISSGRLSIFSGITYDVDADNTDGDYTVAANTIVAEITDNLTANRTLTMPTASVNGQSVTLLMRFSAGSNHYSLASALVDNSTGSTFTQLDWGVTYDFMVDQGLAWRLIRKY